MKSTKAEKMEYIRQRPDISEEELAQKMKGDGLYAQSTQSFTITHQIRRARETWKQLKQPPPEK